MFDYEYDTPSDSDDDQQYFNESHWHNIRKRLKFNHKGIIITLMKDDSLENIPFLLDAIKQGISMQSLAYNYSIESLHNAIVNNPLKSKSQTNGRKRLQEMRRLESLMENDQTPISYIKDIYSLIIQDTPSQLKVKGMRHLTKLKIIGSVNRINLNDCPLIDTVEIRDSERVPWFIGHLPNKIVLHNVQNFEILSAGLRNVQFYVYNSRIAAYILVLLRDAMVIDDTCTVLCSDNEILSYRDWYNKKYKVFNIVMKKI